MTTTIQDLKEALYVFAELDRKMQISTVITLLEIAEAELKRENISTHDIAKKLGMNAGAASRNTYYWGSGHEQMTGGHQFISITIDPLDRRKRELRVTSKGRAFLNRLTGEDNATSNRENNGGDMAS